MKKYPSLWFCVAMDAIGMLSYSIPFLGEFSDVVWAPLSALIFFFTFGGKKGAMGAILQFTEEALPFLDFIPSFTIAWFIFGSQKSQAQEITLQYPSISTAAR